MKKIIFTAMLLSFACLVCADPAALPGAATPQASATAPAHALTPVPTTVLTLAPTAVMTSEPAPVLTPASSLISAPSRSGGASTGPEFGAGNVYGQFTFKEKWNDDFTSGLTLFMTYTNDQNNWSGGTNYMSYKYYIGFMPLHYYYFKNDIIRMSAGPRFQVIISDDETYYSKYSTVAPSRFLRLHDYSLSLELANMELIVPFVPGLYVNGALGITSTWDYNNYGKPTSLLFQISGFNVGSLGLVYYFGESRPAK